MARVNNLPVVFVMVMTVVTTILLETTQAADPVTDWIDPEAHFISNREVAPLHGREVMRNGFQYTFKNKIQCESAVSIF